MIITPAKIKELIKSSHLNLEQIGHRSGVRPETIRTWMYGSRNPSHYNLVAVINVLGYDFELVKLQTKAAA